MLSAFIIGGNNIYQVIVEQRGRLKKMALLNNSNSIQYVRASMKYWYSRVTRIINFYPWWCVQSQEVGMPAGPICCTLSPVWLNQLRRASSMVTGQWSCQIHFYSERKGIGGYFPIRSIRLPKHLCSLHTFVSYLWLTL